MSRVDVSAESPEDSINPFSPPMAESNEQQLWAEVYDRQYPSAAELADLDLQDLSEVVTELRDEVALLEEEAEMFQRAADPLRGRPRQVESPVSVPASLSVPRKSLAVIVGEDNAMAESNAGLSPNTSALDSTQSPAGQTPVMKGIRGQAYRHRSVEAQDMYVSLEDRAAMLTKERERQRQQKERDEREQENMRDLLMATVEEAASRRRELQLEEIKFKREVVDDDGLSSADDLLRYMSNRQKAQAQYLDKLNVQAAALERSIMQSQQHLRQRHAAGEAFHAIDFEQLRIENQQFNERIERKNLELVELKGTSTRTVQTLNTLMDALNGLMAEQNRLRKDYKNRCEYLGRLKREMVFVEREADAAERKNAVIKAQHEVVRVPKIEHYIAQKAEEYELNKAEKNWKRKVEIADGQLQLTHQQVRMLTVATDPHRRRFRIGKKAMGGRVPHKASGSAIDVEVMSQDAPVVGGSKALLNKKRKAN